MSTFLRMFADPAWLLALPVISVPIIIHLLNRTRYRRVRFAAMEFLFRAMERTRRRVRFEHWLLLLLRCLALFLLVAAFARPQDETFSAQEPTTHLYLVIDNSASMSYRAGDEAIFDRARRQAVALCDQLTPDRDAVTVITLWPTAANPFASLPGAVPAQGDAATSGAAALPLFFSRDLGEVKRFLTQKLEPAPRGTDLAGAWNAVAAMIDQQAQGEIYDRRHVVLITDGQRAAWPQASADRQTLRRKLEQVRAALGESVMVLDVGVEGARGNFSVDQVAVDQQPVAVGMETLVVITVTNRSSVGSAPRGAELTLEIGDEPVLLNTGALDPGASVVLRHLWRFEKPGFHRILATLEADALAWDNEARLVLDVRPGIRALLIDGEPARADRASELWFFQFAIETNSALTEPSGATGPVRLPPVLSQVISADQWREPDLTGIDCVGLFNVRDLSAPGVLGALEDFVRGGGGLLVALGDQVRDLAYRESLFRQGEGLLPGAVMQARGLDEQGKAQGIYTVSLGDVSPADPVVGRFLEDEDGTALLTNPANVLIKGFWELALPEAAISASRARVLLWATEPAQADGAPGARFPLLVASRFGQGRVLTWTSTLDHEWNTLYRSAAYVPFCLESVYQLAAGGDQRRALKVGMPFVEQLRAEDFAPLVRVTDERGLGDGVGKTLQPVGEATPGQAPRRYRLTHAQTSRPGFYTVHYTRAPGDERRSEFAVNFDSAESDLTRLNESARERFQDVGEAMRRWYGDTLRYSTAQVGELSAEMVIPPVSRFWETLLIAVLVMLGLEALLAFAIGRRGRLRNPRSEAA